MLDIINKIDYNIISWLENNLRNNVFDNLFKIITEIGDKFVFILIVVILFWVVNKRFAYKFLFAFIGSAFINQVAKMIIKRPRPFYEEGITSVGKESSGYSFPSGHSQSTGIIYYSFNDEFGKKNKIIKIVLIAILILVPFSRMYLAQHYLTDVLVGTIIGIISAIIMYKIFDFFKEKEHIYPLFAIPIVLIVLTLLINKDYNKYHEIFIAGAGYIGFTIGYAIEKIYIKHDVNTTFQNKIFKVIIGLLILGIAFFGLKELFLIISVESMLLDFIRYLTVALIATIFIPYLFTKIFKQ